MKQELSIGALHEVGNEIAVVTSNSEQLRESFGISSVRPFSYRTGARTIPFPGGRSTVFEHAPVQSVEPPVPRHEISIGHDIGMTL